MWKDFKEFALRGNVIDLAIAVVIGAAFGKIISSLVENIIMPAIGALTGGIDFTGEFVWTIGNASIMIGTFIQSIIDFLIIAFCIFMALRIFNKYILRRDLEENSNDNGDLKEELLKEIRDLLKEQNK